MPKKFGTNTKSAEARAKKEAVKIADKEKKEREAEEALWADNDKHVARKQQRKVKLLGEIQDCLQTLDSASLVAGVPILWRLSSYYDRVAS
ncbi:hypothetical protein HPB50_029383 [Hyalomma asiaticum]|nr:hypothetical protein HPB50_029383 [Hyalomma asiaticum]